MDKKKLERAISHAGRYLHKTLPTILTCVSAVGVVVTAVMAVKATPKALTLLDEAEKEKGEKLSALETVATAAPVYIPSAMAGLFTISCLFGANAVNQKRQASLAGALVMMERSFNEYREKARKIFGQDGDEQIRAEIAQDHFKETCIYPYIGVEEQDSNAPLLVFYDEWSKRYFQRTLAEVQAAEYHLNRNYILRGYADLNEFYRFLDLPETDLGSKLGWSMDAAAEFYGYSWIDFEHKSMNLGDGNVCYRIDTPFAPTYDFMDYGYPTE